MTGGRKFAISRNTVLFVFGLAGIGYETLWEHADRPTLLVVFAACCGLPAFLGKNEPPDPPAPPSIPTPSPPASPTPSPKVD